MIIERFKQGKIKEIYMRFERKGRMLPEGVHFIDSWIDERIQICFQLMEAPNIDYLKKWAEQWSDLVDFEFYPILDSAKAKNIVFGNDS